MAWDSSTRYKLLLDVNNVLINQTSREDMFREMARLIHKIYPYDRCGISIYEAESASLRWFAVSEGVLLEDMDVTTRPLDKGQVAQAVISSRQPLIIPDMSRYTHWDTIRRMMAVGLRSTMAFPLIVRGRMIGTLHFSSKEAPPDLKELVNLLTELSGQVALAVDNMLAHTKLMELNANLEQQKNYLIQSIDPHYHPDNFHHSSPAMCEILRQVEVVASSDASVLITGETGTGKDHIARYIHALSGRRDALFVKVNCPALVESLFESELFGHAKGAFTGANAKRVGRFEMAKGGTLFLDEIGELPMPLQAKLLHVLQDKRFERVGDSRSIEVDFRVLAATNNDLETAIKNKGFRADLFYRLNTISFHIPPLRERVEEIEPLVLMLTRDQAAATRRPPPTYSPDAMDAFRRHSWPGNIRELRNIVNRLIIVHSGRTVTRGDIAPILNTPRPELDSPPTRLAEVERDYLARVLEMTKGVVGGKNGATAILQMPKSTLQYKMRKHGLNPKDFAS